MVSAGLPEEAVGWGLIASDGVGSSWLFAFERSWLSQDRNVRTGSRPFGDMATASC